MEDLLLTIKKITDNLPVKIVLSSPYKKDCEFRKIEITNKVKIYQATKFTDKQVIHDNILPDELGDYIWDKIKNEFSQLNSFSVYGEQNIKITKKKKLFYTESKSKTIYQEPTEEHNRVKNYIFKEGEQISPLIDMGIFTQNGKIVASMYDKYKQINRFIEMVDDSIKSYNLTKLNVVDFGCGKSYLTFLLYYYLREIRNIDVTIVGLDLKDDVIEKCNIAAKKYNYSKLSFQTGDIKTFKADFPIDMVITLHACDTATDYALIHSVLWDAKMIFSVPCCQHELNSQIDSEKFSLLTRYGIIKEHISSAFTDAIRANLLTYCGYKTQLLEFIESSHTPKNILIRAVKRNISQATKEKALNEVLNVTSEFNLSPSFLSLLQENSFIK